MSNSINRQSLSDYEKDLAAWRKAAAAYNANIGTHNAQVADYNKVGGAYDAEVNAYNAQVNAYNQSVADFKANNTLSGDGQYYANGPSYTNEELANMTWGDNLDPLGASFGMPVEPPTQPNLTVPTRPEIQAPTTPEKFAEKNVKAPGLTLQQEKDLNKSDSPLADAERGEKGKFSPFKAEEGLVARAMKGFK